MRIWRRCAWRQTCAQAISFARRCGLLPSMSASVWPLAFSRSVWWENVSTNRQSQGGLRRRRAEPTACTIAGMGDRLSFAHPTYSRSMQPEHAVDGPQLGRLDQLGVRNGDGVERAFELLLPEEKKILQRRKIRKQIVICLL